jgi:hypothetical protein
MYLILSGFILFFMFYCLSKKYCRPLPHSFKFGVSLIVAVSLAIVLNTYLLKNKKEIILVDKEIESSHLYLPLSYNNNENSVEILRQTKAIVNSSFNDAVSDPPSDLTWEQLFQDPKSIDHFYYGGRLVNQYEFDKKTKCFASEEACIFLGAVDSKIGLNEEDRCEYYRQLSVTSFRPNPNNDYNVIQCLSVKDNNIVLGMKGKIEFPTSNAALLGMSFLRHRLKERIRLACETKKNEVRSVASIYDHTDWLCQDKYLSIDPEDNPGQMAFRYYHYDGMYGYSSSVAWAPFEFFGICLDYPWLWIPLIFSVLITGLAMFGFIDTLRGNSINDTFKESLSFLAISVLTGFIFFYPFMGLNALAIIVIPFIISIFFIQNLIEAIAEALSGKK